jgi:hypothetical protein
VPMELGIYFLFIQPSVANAPNNTPELCDTPPNAGADSAYLHNNQP